MQPAPAIRSLRSLFAVVPFAAVAAAQDISITNANVTFRVEFNATPVVNVATSDFLRADPAGDPTGALFETAWAYRLDNDTREFIFTDANQQATFTSTGPLGTATWNDVDQRGRIAATATYLALPLGPTSGVVVCRMEIRNISTSPVTLNLFHLADIDLCGPGWTSNWATPGSDGRQVFTGTTCSETSEHFGCAADRWEIGSYTNTPAGNVDLYTKLEDTGITTLRNDTAPFGPQDMRGAFQWQDRVLLPNQTETYTIALTHNARACPSSFNVFGASTGGAAGAPVLSSGIASLGSSLTLTMNNAPPSSAGILVFGLQPGTTTLGDLTLHMTGATANFFLPVGPSGSVSQTLAIPNNAAFCGIPLLGQGFVLGDPTSTSTTGLAVTHTRGAIWIVGMY